MGIIVLISRSVWATLSEGNSLLMESSHGKCLSEPSGMDNCYGNLMINDFACLQWSGSDPFLWRGCD